MDPSAALKIWLVFTILSERCEIYNRIIPGFLKGAKWNSPPSIHKRIISLVSFMRNGFRHHPTPLRNPGCCWGEPGDAPTKKTSHGKRLDAAKPSRSERLEAWRACRCSAHHIWWRRGAQSSRNSRNSAGWKEPGGASLETTSEMQLLKIFMAVW